MTGSVFDELPYEEGRAWELFNGDLKPMSSPTLEHQEIIFRILLALMNILAGSGKAATDVEFALAPNTRLRPDVWVVCSPRADEMDWTRVPVAGCPDLAIEVISPSESATQAMRKVELYLAHGVQEVWQVFADTRQVMIHTNGERVEKLRVGDTLTTALLPGLQLDVRRVFEN